MNALSFAALAMLIPGLWFLFLAVWSRNPDHLGTAVGTLTKCHTSKNVATRHGVVKNLTDYVYTYQVNGKTYKITGMRRQPRRMVLRKVTVVYLKISPRRAYIDQFTCTVEWLLAFVLLAGAFVYLFISLAA